MGKDTLTEASDAFPTVDDFFQKDKHKLVSSFLLGSSYFQGQTVKPQECFGGVFEVVCLGGALGVRMISLELLLAKGTFQISGGSGGVGCFVGLNTSVDGLKLQNFGDFVFTYEIRIGSGYFSPPILAGIHFSLGGGEWGMPLMVTQR